jgi:hypothetical protein
VVNTLYNALAALGAAASVLASDQASPCDEFFEVLEAVPHVSLSRTAGPIEPTWAGEPPPECQVDFVTTDSILNGAMVPDFIADPETEMFRSGWRMIPEILADGAGSRVHGITREPIRCVVRWDKPAYLDDSGDLVQSQTTTMLIQCRGDSREKALTPPVKAKGVPRQWEHPRGPSAQRDGLEGASNRELEAPNWRPR